MNSVDWTKPLEAVHTDGRVVSIDLLPEDEYDRPHEDGTWAVDSEVVGNSNVFNSDGSCWSDSEWRIRNVQPTPSAAKIDDALVERMVALVRDMDKAPTSPGFVHYDRARAIAALLPKPVDPDLVEAREIAAKIVQDLGSSPFYAAFMREGHYDDGKEVQIALAALKIRNP